MTTDFITYSRKQLFTFYNLVRLCAQGWYRIGTIIIIISRCSKIMNSLQSLKKQNNDTFTTAYKLGFYL